MAGAGRVGAGNRQAEANSNPGPTPLVELGLKHLFEMEEIKLSVAAEALGAIARKAIDRKTGARGLGPSWRPYFLT